MNRLVRHHEAFADISLGPGAHLRRGVLDFTNDETGGVPVRAKEREGRRDEVRKNEMEQREAR